MDGEGLTVFFVDVGVDADPDGDVDAEVRAVACGADDCGDTTTDRDGAEIDGDPDSFGGLGAAQAVPMSSMPTAAVNRV